MRTPMRRIPLCCCARAATGPAAVPPRSVMNSRRFIAFPIEAGSKLGPSKQESKTSETGCWCGIALRKS
jgi:hypothetical protein